MTEISSMNLKCPDCDVRIISLPDMDMIWSPAGNPEEQDGPLQKFHKWVLDDLYQGECPIGSIYAVNDGGFRFLVKIPKDYVNEHGWEEYRFGGGYYAVYSTWITEIGDIAPKVSKWLEEHPLFQSDERKDAQRRYVLSHMITPGELQRKLSNEQHDIYIPITLKEQES